MNLDISRSSLKNARSWRGPKRPPDLPKNWYAVATLKELKKGASLVREIGGIELVVFRTHSGTVSAFKAHCAHMGCHLRHADVIDETLRCALHNRRISPEGQFLGPGGAPYENLKQTIYPVEVAYGAVFVFLGGTPGGPVARPDNIEPDQLLMKPAGQFVSDANWYGMVANGFDMEHLLSVHKRRLKEDAVISQPDPLSYRLSYRTEVTGTSLADRLIKWMSNNDVRASMTAVRGTTMIVQSEAGLVPTTFLLSLCPDSAGGTLVRGFVGLKKGRFAWLDACKLFMAKWLFKDFLAKDFEIFKSLNWHPPQDEHTDGDVLSNRFYNYFLSLENVDTASRSYD